MADRIFKFGIIGYGHIGKRHAETIANMSNAELVAVVDTGDVKLANNIKHVPLFQSIEALIASTIELDVVNICTPNGYHSEQAMAMLQHNCNVIIEKPMGLSAVECKKVIDLAIAKEKKAYCVMQNRYSPPATWLKEIHDSGKLGKIHLIQVNCFWNRDERYYTKENGSWRGTLNLDGGTLYTQFSHFIDLLYWVFGDILIQHADFQNFNHKELIDFEDSGMVRFTLKEGGYGTINYSTAVNKTNFESSISVIAENGTIKIGGQYMNQVDYCEIDNYTFQPLDKSNPPNDYGSYIGSANNHPHVMENVIEDLSGNPAKITSAREGMKVIEIIEKIYSKRTKI